MKSITVKQPWASLIVEGIKDIENRTWKCPQKYIGKRVLIHASLAKSEFNFTNSQHKELNRLNKRRWYDREQEKGAIIGSVEIVECVEYHKSIWAEKSIDIYDQFSLDRHEAIYNWVLANPIKFPKPIPAKGRLSFWDYPNILAEPEEEGGELYCHCDIPVEEENQVTGDSRFGFYCRYCGGKWYK